MEKDIKIAIIGGTGKSGSYLVKLLMNEGFHLKLLLRDPDKFTRNSSLIEIIKGSVADYEDVKTVTSGCQSVISMLGMGQPPSAPDIFSRSTSNILRAMDENSIQRYIVITGLNVDAPSDNKSSNIKAATDWMYKNYPLSTLDKQKEYNLLRVSNIDWTLVRLPMIELTDSRGPVLVNSEDCPGDKISATDLAFFLKDQLFEDTYIKMAPFLANAKIN